LYLIEEQIQLVGGQGIPSRGELFDQDLLFETCPQVFEVKYKRTRAADIDQIGGLASRGLGTVGQVQFQVLDEGQLQPFHAADVREILLGQLQRRLVGQVEHEVAARAAMTPELKLNLFDR